MRRSTLLSLASLLPVASAGAVAAAGPAAAQERPATAVPAPGAGSWPAWARPLLLIGGLAAFDRPVRRASRDLQGGVAGDVAAFGRWFGDWRGSGPYLLGGTLAVALAAEGERGWRVASAVTLGVLAGSFVNEGVNVAIGRDRPNAGDGPWRFDPFSGHASFPSGHTALGFAFAGAVDEVTEGWAPAVAAYAAATLTGLSRVYDDKHWATDIAAGALVGATTARMVTRLALSRLGGGKRARETGSDAVAERRAHRVRARRTRPPPRIDVVATPRFVGLRIVH